MNHALPNECDANAQIAPLLLTPEQAAAALGICRTRVYQLMTSGKLDSVQIGTSRRIAVADLEAFVERLRGKGAVQSSATDDAVGHDRS